MLLTLMDECANEWYNTRKTEDAASSWAFWNPLLRSVAWLKDDIMETRLQALQTCYWLWGHQDPYPTSAKKHIMITNVFFPKKLYDYSTNSYHYGPDIVKYCHTPLLRPCNIHDGFRLILIPYNTGGNHWVLFAIDFVDRRIHLYDSMSSSYGVVSSSCNDHHDRYRYIHTENWMFIHALAMFINDEWKLQQATSGHSLSRWEHGMNFDGWYTMIHTDVPQQEEKPLANCGLHVLMTAQYIVAREHERRSQEAGVPSSVPAPTSHIPRYTSAQWKTVRQRLALESISSCLYRL